jgi:hypothetical protein
MRRVQAAQSGTRRRILGKEFEHAGDSARKPAYWIGVSGWQANLSIFFRDWRLSVPRRSCCGS